MRQRQPERANTVDPAAAPATSRRARRREQRARAQLPARASTAVRASSELAERASSAIAGDDRHRGKQEVEREIGSPGASATAAREHDRDREPASHGQQFGGPVRLLPG